MPRTNPPLRFGELRHLLTRAGFELFTLHSNKALYRHPSGVHVRIAMEADGKSAGARLTQYVKRVIAQVQQVEQEAQRRQRDTDD